MKDKWLIKATSVAFVYCITSLSNAEVLFETDFENGFPNNVTNPVWKLPITVGNLVGKGNIFEVVNTVSHSGNFSLRFNYEGANNICNQCGGRVLKQSAAYDSKPFIVDKEGRDMTLDPHFATGNRLVYNQTDNYAVWKINSNGISSQNAVNDKLDVTKILSGVEALNKTADGALNSDDSLFVQRECGVDGSVGGNIIRRSDCNLAIGYFDRSIVESSQKYGQSLYRRVYVKIDDQASLNDLPQRQKARYWTDAQNRTVYLVFARNLTKGSFFPTIEGTKNMGGPSFIKHEEFNMMSKKWYYIEEQFKAHSGPGKNDGEYRLWFAEAGSESIKPVVELTGLDLSTVQKASLWGNHQHTEDSSSFWYIDDLAIANVRIGPTRPSGKKIFPPKSPTPVP